MPTSLKQYLGGGGAVELSGAQFNFSPEITNNPALGGVSVTDLDISSGLTEILNVPGKSLLNNLSMQGFTAAGNLTVELEIDGEVVLTKTVNTANTSGTPYFIFGPTSSQQNAVSNGAVSVLARSSIIVRASKASGATDCTLSGNIYLIK